MLGSSRARADTGNKFICYLGFQNIVFYLGILTIINLGVSVLKGAKILVHITNSDGHRLSYQNLLIDILDGDASIGVITKSKFWELVTAPKVFFATIDDDYYGFIAVALTRLILNRSTSGIFLRPLQCFRSDRPIIFRLMRVVFGTLRKIKKIRLLSIIPHEIIPRLNEITDDWIYDPQMWDLWLKGAPILPDTSLSVKIDRMRIDRKVLVFIGAANRIKGYDQLVSLAELLADKVLIVVAGKVAQEYKVYSQRLIELGVIVEDRFISENELLSLYKVSDFAWCCYAKDYDQASGVFGRAIQTGVCPIVRGGSIVSQLPFLSVTLDQLTLLINQSESEQLKIGKNQISDLDVGNFEHMRNSACKKLLFGA